MIEFNETFDEILTDKEALKKKIETRLKHTTSNIPYYSRGIDIMEFTYGSVQSAIKFGLRDFGANVNVDTVNSRVQVYNIIVPYES